MDIIVFIWDLEDGVYTKPLEFKSLGKVLKFKGRKANKVLIPESLNSKNYLDKIKKLVSYKCLTIIVPKSRSDTIPPKGV